QVERTPRHLRIDDILLELHPSWQFCPNGLHLRVFFQNMLVRTLQGVRRVAGKITDPPHPKPLEVSMTASPGWVDAAAKQPDFGTNPSVRFCQKRFANG